MVSASTTAKPVEPVAVTQADRDAAVRILPGNTIAELARLGEVMRGDRDQHPMVQAFARHRLSAITAATAEQVSA